MENNTKVDLRKWQLGFIISSIAPLIGGYLLITIWNIPYIGEMLLALFGGLCVSGLIVLIGIIGAIYCLVQINQSSALLSSREWIITITIPVIVWLFVVGLMISKPTNESLMVIQSRIGKKNLSHINMAQADLSGINLEGADLSGANFENANLKSVNLNESNLEQANLNDTNLMDASLNGANLEKSDLTGANLHGAWMIDANLDEAKINLNQLINVKALNGTIMPDGQKYDGRFFLSEDINPQRNYEHKLDICDASKMASFYGITLKEYQAALEWARNNPPEVKIPYAATSVQSGANLRGPNYQRSIKIFANFNGADLSEADFWRAKLCYATLIEAILDGANLHYTNLRYADLTNAKIRNTNCEQANFLGAELSGITLVFSNLTDAKVTDKQLVQASQLRGTIMPEGNLYDGRFNLPKDLEEAALLSADMQSPEEMAQFYGVSVKEYMAGQEWADENLPKTLGDGNE